METRLRQAIEQNLLSVYYQPIVDCQNEEICGAEALCRWNDKERGPISPLEFIPIAEESGLIMGLGKWMLEQACSDAQKWQEKNFKPITVSVNITQAQLLSKNFRELILEILKKTKLDPQLLKLEITESAFIQNLSDAVVIMKEIISLGVRFVVDDFGTGYSSLSYLRELPICALKIDKSFIDPITHNSQGAALTQSIIGIGKSLGLEIVAEGVESKEQLLFLRAYQCSYIQGYLFSKPLPQVDFENLLKTI
ncbi:MAG: EAL domain-containing protein [Alphaproteobacteria bacterium]|nr:EAL domain-containing protein [Alphaproteobacteria bacterium]